MTKLKLNGNGNGNGKNGNGHGAGLLKIALLGIAVLLVGVLLFRQAQRVLGPERVVYVASGNLAPGVMLDASDYQRRSMRQSDVPQGAVDDPGQIEGQELVRPKREGEPFVREDISTPRAPEVSAASLAELLPEGRVLASVRADVQSVIMRELRFGDRFEIVASGREREGAVSGVVASDAYFLAWIDPELLEQSDAGAGDATESGRGGLLASLLAPPPELLNRGRRGGAGAGTELLLALYPEDVLPVTRAAAAGHRLSLVLHGAAEVKEGRMLELPQPQPAAVELISGGSRERVPVL